MFDLISNPFLWQGHVFMIYGLLVGVTVSSLWGFPKRLLEAI
jgi:hypothetical protein